MKTINTKMFKKAQENMVEEEDSLQEENVQDAAGNLPIIDIEEAQSRYLADSVDEEIDSEVDEEQDDPENYYTGDFEKDLEREEKYPEFANTRELIDWGTRNNEVINIMYRTKRGAIINRNVEPHGSFYARTTKNFIVVTFDRTVNDIRSFIVENVIGGDFLGKKFSPKFIVR